MGSTIAIKFNSAHRCFVLLNADHLLDCIFKVEFSAHFSELAWINLGKIEEIIDQEAHQIWRAVLNFVTFLNHVY